MLLAGLVVWQLALAGHAAWLCANAARVAARAEAVGGDGAAAARSAVPAGLRSGMRVEVSGSRVHVAMRPPSPLAAFARALEVNASAAVGEP